MTETRARLSASGIPPAELDELEDHLREQFADLLARGLRPDEAWWLAERRLGPPKLLAREFGEVRLPMSIVWMTLGGLTFLIGETLVYMTPFLVRSWTGSTPAIWLALVMVIGLLAWIPMRLGQRALAAPGRALAGLVVLLGGLLAFSSQLTGEVVSFDDPVVVAVLFGQWGWVATQLVAAFSSIAISRRKQRRETA